MALNNLDELNLSSPVYLSKLQKKNPDTKYQYLHNVASFVLWWCCIILHYTENCLSYLIDQYFKKKFKKFKKKIQKILHCNN